MGDECVPKGSVCGSISDENVSGRVSLRTSGVVDKRSRDSLLSPTLNIFREDSSEFGILWRLATDKELCLFSIMVVFSEVVLRF